jgi:uncharacterized membrane protein
MDAIRQNYGLDLRQMRIFPRSGLATALAIGGVGLLVLGLGRRSVRAIGAGAALMGGMLVYRGATGRHGDKSQTISQRAAGGAPARQKQAA